MSRGHIAGFIVGVVCLSAALAGAQTVLNQKDVPITIKKSGSYILASNLKVTNPTVDAILVAASNVTIDLNGFTIEGPPKGPTSNGSAIQSDAGGGNVVVKNGTISGGFFEAAAACIHLAGQGNRIENVHVTGCGGTAIYAEGVVTHCEVKASWGGIGVGRGEHHRRQHGDGN